jgi:thiol-disulfide isomerase/thioredoxin
MLNDNKMRYNQLIKKIQFLYNGCLIKYNQSIMKRRKCRMKKSWINIVALSLVTIVVTVGCSTTQVDKDAMKETPVEVTKDASMEKDASMSEEKEMETKEEMPKDEVASNEAASEEVETVEITGEVVATVDASMEKDATITEEKEVAKKEEVPKVVESTSEEVQAVVASVEKATSMTEEKEVATQEEMPKEEEIANEEVAATDSIVLMTNEGKQAPAFEFVDFDGNIVNNASLKGKKVYLKYWASWCSVCRASLPEVDKLFIQDKDFTVYTVVTPNANGEMSQDEFITWFEDLEQKNIKVVFDMKGQAAKEFGVRAFPTSIFIGSDGVLIQTAPGHKANDAIVKSVEAFY